MDTEVVQELCRLTLMKTLVISGPILIIGMVIGLLMGIFQSITSIQETTVAFVPKMLAVGGALVLLFPWMMNLLNDFTIELFSNLAQYAK
jgi:flagellar biosynthetic protein FliQ